MHQKAFGSKYGVRPNLDHKDLSIGEPQNYRMDCCSRVRIHLLIMFYNENYAMHKIESHDGASTQ